MRGEERRKAEKAIHLLKEVVMNWKNSGKHRTTSRVSWTPYVAFSYALLRQIIGQFWKFSTAHIIRKNLLETVEQLLPTIDEFSGWREDIWRGEVMRINVQQTMVMIMLRLERLNLTFLSTSTTETFSYCTSSSAMMIHLLF